MKLMFCPDCQDVFRLMIKQVRSCQCGKVKGYYLDLDLAVTNGQGIAIALDNDSLDKIVKKLGTMDQNRPDSFYKSYAKIRVWARPNSGPGNPRTKIVHGL